MALALLGLQQSIPLLAQLFDSDILFADFVKLLALLPKLFLRCCSLLSLIQLVLEAPSLLTQARDLAFELVDSIHETSLDGLLFIDGSLVLGLKFILLLLNVLTFFELTYECLHLSGQRPHRCAIVERFFTNQGLARAQEPLKFGLERL